MVTEIGSARHALGRGDIPGAIQIIDGLLPQMPPSAM